MVAIVSPGAIVSTSIWFGHFVVNAVEVRPGPWLVVAVEIAEALCQTLVKVSAPPTMPSSVCAPKLITTLCARPSCGFSV